MEPEQISIRQASLSDIEGIVARRITALVEKDHPWAVAFGEAVGYQLDQRMVRYFRNL